MEAVSLAGKVLLNRYRVVRPLGQGALATVYLAFDRFGTPYALKVFPRGAEARRNREFWVGRQLSHPNLNPVLESLDLEEGPALLLAYAPGEEMGRWMGVAPSALGPYMSSANSSWPWPTCTARAWCTGT